jgi:hypothetical protein
MEQLDEIIRICRGVLDEEMHVDSFVIVDILNIALELKSEI